MAVTDEASCCETPVWPIGSLPSAAACGSDGILSNCQHKNPLAVWSGLWLLSSGPEAHHARPSLARPPCWAALLPVADLQLDRGLPGSCAPTSALWFVWLTALEYPRNLASLSLFFVCICLTTEHHITSKMVRRLLAALALAHGAAALLEGFVDVLVNVDVRIPKDIVAQAMGAATEDEAYNACSSIDSRLYDCYESGWLEPTAPAASVRNCLCCAGTAAIAESYSVCSSYIANSVGGDDASTAVKCTSFRPPSRVAGLELTVTQPFPSLGPSARPWVPVPAPPTPRSRPRLPPPRALRRSATLCPPLARP